MRKPFAWGGLGLFVLAGGAIWLLSSVGFAEDPTLPGFPALRSESIGSDGRGSAVLWRISSTVERVPQEAAEQQRLPLFVSEQDHGERAIDELYRYQYVFENDGASPIRINLSEWDVIQSPLTDVLQGFELKLDAHKTTTVEFLTDKSSAPQNVLSPVNVAVWHAGENRWRILGAGKASLYTPSGLGLAKAGSVHQIHQKAKP